MFIYATLNVATSEYLPYAIFNIVMPIIVAIMAYMGYTVADKDGVRMTKRAQAKKKAQLKEQA